MRWGFYDLLTSARSIVRTICDYEDQNCEMNILLFWAVGSFEIQEI